MSIKVAIIGCGSITEFRHAPEYKANQNVEIVAFCDPQINRAERLAGQFGGMYFSDYMEVLNIKDLDAVSVCTTNSTHADITVEALKSGLHVLCEKPMATTFEDAQRMIEMALKYDKFLMIGHNQRFIDTHIRAKQILSSNELGRVLSFKICFGHGGPERWSADKGKNTWFFKKDSAFVGAMGDLGIHKADLIRWLIADEIDEVYAMFSTIDKRNEKNELIDVEDNATCILKSRSGIVGNLNASWTYYGEEDNSTVLYCEKGIMRIFSHPEFPLMLEKRNGEKVFIKTEKIQTNESQSKSGVIDAFIESIIKGDKPEISGEEGIEALNIILACMESHEKKSSIKVRHI